MNSFAIKGDTVWAFFSALPNDSGVARSTDNGNTWQVVPSIITNAGESIVSDNAIIVAEDNFIWRSTDDGMSWDVVEQFALTGIGGFAKAGTKLFGAARTGIQTSTDNGASWNFEPFSNGAYSFSAVGSTIYLGSNNKIFKSTDLGATWIDMSTGLGKGGIQALLYDGTTLFAGTPADAAGIYRSTNGGQSWDPAAAGLPIASEVRSLIAFGGYVFVGMQWGCRVTEYTGRQITAIRGPRLTSIILCSPTRSCWHSVLRTITSLLELLMVFTNQPTAAQHFKGL